MSVHLQTPHTQPRLCFMFGWYSSSRHFTDAVRLMKEQVTSTFIFNCLRGLFFVWLVVFFFFSKLKLLFPFLSGISALGKTKKECFLKQHRKKRLPCLPVTPEYKDRLCLHGRQESQHFLRAEVSKTILDGVTVTQRPVCSTRRHVQQRAAGSVQPPLFPELHWQCDWKDRNRRELCRG